MDRTSDLLQVRLLGGFDLRSGHGRDAPPLGRKVRALLACLALSAGKPWPREKLMALLWSDRGEQQARASLRQALAELRRVLGEPSPLRAEHDAVSLDPAMIALDAVEFERLAKAGRLDEAAALYRGPLLDGHGVRDDAFEEWLRVERSRLHDLAVDALDRLAASQSGDATMKTAQRLLQLDPAREETHRLLMRLYAAVDQRAQALRQYQQCCDALQRELQAQPDIETERLYRQIQDEAMPAATVGPAAPDAAPALGSKPSIAVLPFENLSGDPEQEYFADGMVEEITMALSRMRWLFVIARNSSFTYKGRAVDVKQVGRELGVRYVLEGSVRKAGNRVRIAGQLIDASTGAHLWADRFEGELEDIFNLQDQVTANVVGTIRPKLERAEIERAKRKPTESLDAYDYFLRGAACLYRWTREANDEALTLLHRAIERDPDFATAYGMAAWCYVWRRVNGWMADRTQEAAEATRLARRAVELGKDDAVALCWGGIVFAYIGGDLDDGGALIEQSLALDPNSAAAWYLSGWVKVWLCEPEAAIERVTRAMRLSPLDPLAYNMLSAIAHAHFIAGRYDDATAWAEKAVRQQPPEYTSAIRILAASRALAGRQADAERAAVRLRQVDPTFRICDLGDRTPLRRPEDLARYAEALRKAGLPA
jgi:TolB-like protein